MNIRCEQIDDLLIEGDALSLETAARHGRQCHSCMEKLTSWLEMSETARSMKTEWNSDLLWPRIERALRREARHSTRSYLVRVAAAVVLTLSIGATAWYAIRAGSHEANFDDDILRISALDEVDRAGREHLAAIERLEKATEPALERSSAPLMVNYKEKLMLLDDAIAECEANIQQNRQNAHLRKQLLAMYSAKQKTLQDVVREGRHASNQ